MVQRPGQTPSGEPQRREHQRHGQQDGSDPTDPPLKPRDGWRQDEREQDGERERHEDGLSQYRTATTSTTPANVTQGFTDFQASSKVLLRCATDLPAAPWAVV